MVDVVVLEGRLLDGVAQGVGGRVEDGNADAVVDERVASVAERCRIEGLREDWDDPLEKAP
jgi:hypothetical protein